MNNAGGQPRVEPCCRIQGERQSRFGHDIVRDQPHQRLGRLGSAQCSQCGHGDTLLADRARQAEPLESPAQRVKRRNRRDETTTDRLIGVG